MQFDPAAAARELRARSDAPAQSARELLDRGRARTTLGRDAEARADFEAAAGECGDEAWIELAYLDIRGRGSVEGAREIAERIAAAAPEDGALEARALHILGLAEGKLRRTAPATDALLRAAERYRALADGAALAQVQDTLGALFAAQGRLDFASAHYAASIVGKLRAGDVHGVALTLGNLGRLHLRAGRSGEALDCFRLDLELARSLGDARGEARMWEDIGRAQAGLEQRAEARAAFEEALALAEPRGYRDLAFFALHDLANLALEERRFDEARALLDRAEATLSEPRDAFLGSLLTSARGRLLAAEGGEGAIALLEDACERFAYSELPDHEVPARIALAEARLARGQRIAAEGDLLRALACARTDGYARYLPLVREAMGRLQIVEAASDERGRLAEPGGKPVGSDGYLLLARLGKGGFGEVWRAYDPQRSQVVALKRFALERLYQPEKRKRVLDSARAELLAASRLRHPGVARVHAFGLDGAESAYVVQEFVDGAPLRARMSSKVPDSTGRILEQAGRIARALQVLHEAGIVHRDLKPENVLLRMPGELPVLIDFGLARVPDGGIDESFVAGTLAYMAPEQAAGGEVGGEADLYSLGVILYEWLAGRRPLLLQGASVDENLDHLQRSRPVPIGELRKDLGGEVTELVDVLLEKDPGDRPSVVDVAQHCEEWAPRLRGRA